VAGRDATIGDEALDAIGELQEPDGVGHRRAALAHARAMSMGTARSHRRAARTAAASSSTLRFAMEVLDQGLFQPDEASAGRTIAGMDSRPACWAARQRRSPAMSSNFWVLPHERGWAGARRQPRSRRRDPQGRRRRRRRWADRCWVRSVRSAKLPQLANRSPAVVPWSGCEPRPYRVHSGVPPLTSLAKSL